MCTDEFVQRKGWVRCAKLRETLLDEGLNRVKGLCWNPVTERGEVVLNTQRAFAMVSWGA